MLRSIRDEEFEADEAPRDIEVTLGPAVLFAIVCGLLLLCGLCFGVGYTSGRRSVAHLAAARKRLPQDRRWRRPASSRTKTGSEGRHSGHCQPAPTARAPNRSGPGFVRRKQSGRSNDCLGGRPALAGERAGASRVRPRITRCNPRLRLVRASWSRWLRFRIPRMQMC